MRRRVLAGVVPLVLVLAPVSVVASGCCGSGSAGAVWSAPAASGSGGCTAPDPGSPQNTDTSGLASCAPGIKRESTMGTIAVDQAGPQQKVYWTVRATVPDGVYLVDVYIGTHRVDHKKQAYPPHATIPLNQDAGLPSGAVLLITGTFTPVNDDPQEFYLRCLLA